MNINPSCASGKHLLGQPHEDHEAHSCGADPMDLEKAKFISFNLQLGGAITLPIPLVGVLILIKSKYLDFDGQVLKDAPSPWLVRHELCHVAQIRSWGTLKDILRHLWARVRTLSILANRSDVEAEYYEVQKRFVDETFT